MARQISAVGRLFVRMVRDEQGGEILEYSMTLGFMALGVYALMNGVGEKVLEMWRRIDAALGAI
jgi:Flp pilus assembly pilin Flp